MARESYNEVRGAPFPSKHIQTYTERGWGKKLNTILPPSEGPDV